MVAAAGHDRAPGAPSSAAAAWPPSPTRTTPARRASRPVGGFLYEPDGAVIRAGLVTAVAAGVDGGLVDEHIAYVTVRRAVPHAVRPRRYEVLEELPYREKPLRAALRERGIGRLTIKKRGVDVVPERAAQAAAPPGRRRGHARAHPGGRRGHRAARPPLLSPRGVPAQLGRTPARSAPIVVSSPWPVCTTVSSGSGTAGSGSTD